MHIDNRLIAALRVCTSKEQIEETFSLFHVTNIKRKQRYLVLAMYNPTLLFLAQGYSHESRYRLSVEHFLAGTWRLFSERLARIEKSVDDADRSLLEKLKPCQNQDDIDSVFDAEHINGLDKRIAALRRIMQITVLNSIPHETAETLADDYAFECAVFLEGSWRAL